MGTTSEWVNWRRTCSRLSFPSSFANSPSKIAYWLSSYPLDVIKSRVQLRATPPSGSPFTYIAHEFREIVKEGGVKGLFRGLSPSLVRSVPAAASTFAAFELTRGQ